MTHYGYARVSTRDQNLDAQEDALEKAGCTRIYVDHGVSGKLDRRPELDKLWKRLKPGDKLTVTKLDRLGRSMKHLTEAVGQLQALGVDLQILNMGIDTATPAGKLTFHIFAALAEFERELIVERTREGLEAARARGRTGGRRHVLTDKQCIDVLERVERGDYVKDVASYFRVSRPTIYGALDRAKELKAAG